jgi:hypothetical protein
MTGKDFRGAIGGKTGKTAVLPGFCKIERGSYLAWARTPRQWRP